MPQSKTIKIQVWTDLNYCRVIGIWYPEEPEDAIDFNDAPYLLVLSSIFEPRTEVMGNNPIAPGQHPIPKDFLEKQIRHISYLFANDFGTFQPYSKGIAKTFLAKQTVSYKKIKEFDMTVTPASGSISLKAFRDSIDQYTEEEQEAIQVMTIGENPQDAHAKDIEDFIHVEKSDNMEQYISITKLTPVYKVDDPYIVKTSLPEDPAFSSLPPGTEDAEASQEFIENVESKKTEDTINRETLKTYDTLSETPQPVLDENGDQVLDENGEPVTELKKPTREEVLEALLKDKESQLAALQPQPVKEKLPQPLSEADLFPEEAADQIERENLNTTFTPKEM